jgi:hypothetical protein
VWSNPGLARHPQIWRGRLDTRIQAYIALASGRCDDPEIADDRDELGEVHVRLRRSRQRRHSRTVQHRAAEEAPSAPPAAAMVVVLTLSTRTSSGRRVPSTPSRKSPYLLALSGRPREAGLLLDHVQRRFMRPDGDLTTTADRKSENAAFQEYWAYPNGWIALGSLRLGRVDVAYPAFDYLRAHGAACGGFFHAPAHSGRR